MAARAFSELSCDDGASPRRGSHDGVGSAAAVGAPGPEAAVAEALDYLRSAGVRRTVMRTALVTALARLGRHATANELAETVAGLAFVPDHAAVVRTLGDLAEQRIVCTVRAGKTARRFGLNRPAHHHAACPRCDLIRSIPADALDLCAVARAAEVDPRTGELIVIGMCTACADLDEDRRTAP